MFVMKLNILKYFRIAFLLFCLMAIKLDTFAQWNIQNSGTSSYLQSVFFLDSIHGWAVGYDSLGTIIKTNDGGQNWSNIEYAKHDWPMSVLFTDSLKGWIVGGRTLSIYDDRGIILHTIDGGLSWNEIEIPDEVFYSVSFINDSIGWVGGSSIYHTINGGGNWTIQKDTILMRELFFISADTGWYVGDNGIIAKTTDGGNNWFLQESNTNNRLWSVHFIDKLNGWICGDNGTILKTTDGGSHWANKYIFMDNTWFFSISATSENQCWATGRDGTIVHTSNGGTTWEFQDNPNSGWMESINFIDSLHGWICGEDGVILSTSNGGFVGISELSENKDEICVYPNPFSNELNIEPGIHKIISVQIYNLQGKLVKTVLFNNRNEKQHRLTIDMLEFPDTIYLLKVTTDNSVQVKKIIRR